MSLVDGFPVVKIPGFASLPRLLFGAKPRQRLVLIDSFGRWGVLGLCASFILRAGLVIRFRGHIFREQHDKLSVDHGLKLRLQCQLRMLAARLCIRRAVLCICNSNFMQEALAPWVGATPLEVVYNPWKGAPPRQGPEIFLPTGRLHLLTVTNMNLPSKVEPTLEAIRDWLAPDDWEGLDLYWVVCGTGTRCESLRHGVRELGLEDRVRVVGWVGNMGQAYQWSHVLVHLTRLDAFPNVTMEALMAGKPVVTNADSCGTREQIFDDQTGFVVDDPESFRRALTRYADDPALRDRHAAHGQEYIGAHFGIDQQRERMHEVLNRFCERHFAG